MGNLEKSDLTILYITAQELPDKWLEDRECAIKSFGYPVIIIGRKHGDIIDREKKSYENIYRQMLVGAKEAKTMYVAIAEDDVFYSEEHFDFRPELDTFAYNQHRWALFTWGEPIYSMRNRKSNCSLIAPRELLIEALEERFNKYPNGIPEAFCGEVGRERVENGLGLIRRKSIEYYSDIGIIQMNHENASEDRQRRKRKSLGKVKAYDIPQWGKASTMLYIWNLMT